MAAFFATVGVGIVGYGVGVVVGLTVERQRKKTVWWPCPACGHSAAYHHITCQRFGCGCWLSREDVRAALREEQVSESR
jgi:hypothetical protein